MAVIENIEKIVAICIISVPIICFAIILLSYLLRATYDIVKEIWKNGVF